MEVLIDHAHCERKAAGSAVQMMFRYLCEPGLGEVLSPLAREELEHFEQVLALIKAARTLFGTSAISRLWSGVGTAHPESGTAAHVGFVSCGGVN